MIEQIRTYFEKQSFGVCTWWGQKLGMQTGDIRLFFIYTSFLTLGSPVIFYLIMAFVLEHKEYFKFKKRFSVWEF